MTAVVEHQQDKAVAVAQPGPDAAGAPASWLARAGAFAIDVLPGLGALAALVPVVWAVRRDTWSWWVSVFAAAVVLLVVVVNRLLLPAVTGWSAGRALFSIAVVRPDGGRVGPWRLLAREVAHLLDTGSVFVGWLWPLWDRRNRTFADCLAKTEVHQRDPRPAQARRRVAVLVSAMTLAAVAAAVLGYTTVYRPELAVAQAREQLAVTGPKIVEDMLSYTPESLQPDFDRAQSLVTDAYRPQLVAQQEAVRKAGPVPNEYWVTDSAVLESTADSATMLMLMQGQRGPVDKKRNITATVKVNFERSAGGQWQVSALEVLAKPAPAPAPAPAPGAGR